MELTTFEFLRQVNPELAAVANQAEASLWNNPRSTLVQGRLFGETMARLVAVEEKLEPVYAIKQVDRLHKLAKEDVITDTIRGAFEWLRMQGNLAVHDSKEIHVDLALTCHRHLFELAVWYVEVYGPLGIILPAYHLPVVPSPDKLEDRSTLDPELFEKVISEQLSTKLLPSLDEKFRTIEEAILRMTQMREVSVAAEIAAPGIASNVVEQPQVEMITPPVAEASTPLPQEGKAEIATVLEHHQLQVIDKREYGGALWVVGGWELKDKLMSWQGQGIRFRYARNGSQSTKRKPAWFLLGKPPDAMRWVAEEQQEPSDSGVEINRTEAVSSPDPAEPFEASAPQNLIPSAMEASAEERVEIDDDSRLSMTVEAVVHDTPAMQSPVTESPDEAELQVAGKSDLAVIIPEHLVSQALTGYVSDRLAAIGTELGAITFGDWSEARLMELYEQQPRQLHDVMVQLWFFGVEFTGSLGRFVKLERPPEDELLGELQADVLLDGVLPADAVRLLGRFGIKVSHQLSRVPVSSLAWLMRGRHEAALEVLRSLEVDLPSLTEPEPDSGDDPVAVKVLRLNGEQLELNASVIEVAIADLPIRGCDAFISGVIHDWGIRTIGELPEDLDILPSRIRGAGAGSVRKFFAQFKSWHDQTNSESQLSQPHEERNAKAEIGSRSAAETGKLLWGSDVYELEDGDHELLLSPDLFIGLSSLMTNIGNAGIHCLGQLPSRLERLKDYPGVGHKAVGKFYANIANRLNTQKKLREERELWESLTPHQRIERAIDQLEQDWQAWLQGSDPSRGKDRNREILQFRWQGLKQGRPATLEEIGQHLELTRERVRQVIQKQLRTLQSDTRTLEQEIKSASELNEGWYHFPLNPKNMFTHYLIAEILSLSGLVYLQECGWWTIRTKETFEGIDQQLRVLLKDVFKGRIFNAYELQEELEPLTSEHNIPLQLAVDLAQASLSPVLDGYYLSGSNKSDLVEMVMRQYPEGVEVYKRAEELIDKANQIRPGAFDTEREMTSVFNREDFSSDIAYLWGRGCYIHSSFVQVDMERIRSVASHAEELLERRSPISVGRLFDSSEEELVQAGVPNEYALYSMLRKLDYPVLQMRKFPHIWHASDSFQIKNAEMIKSYIRELNRPVSREELKLEFVDRRGWKYFTLDYNLSVDKDFVRADHSVISLKEFYPLTSEELQELHHRLAQILDSRSLIHINVLFEEHQTYCRSLDISSPSLLYDLLEQEHPEELRFPRYPFVHYAGQDVGAVNMQVLVEQYILEQGNEVSRESLMQWLTEELGARDAVLDLALMYSKDIIYYTRGRYGEYVHRSNLGWTEERDAALAIEVNDELQRAEEEGKLYLSANQLFNSVKLPVLDHGLDWTIDLLIDLLKKGEHARFIGSYDEIVVSNSNSIIAKDSDFVAYIIRHEFGGSVEQRELRKRLANLRYSKDGQLLQSVVSDIEQGIGKIKQDGNCYFVH